MNAPIAVTMGEPAGIGGEIALGAYLDPRTRGVPFFLIDDPYRIAALADHVGWRVPIETIGRAAEANAVFARALPVLPIGERVPLALGVPTSKTAGAVLGSIDTAVALCLSGEAAGMVTNPIQKSAVHDAGFPHPGHTEYLAALAEVPRTVMMLASDTLRVVPVTIHIPLKDVPGALTREEIVDTARIVARALASDFGIPAPRLAIAGLNPHAGEDGRFGREEQTIITPAIEMLRAEGIAVAGPLSGDTMFHSSARVNYDVALAMYHDQALIPFKTLVFDEGVNVTLGLPFVRTSPDHGTALSLAGTGTARPHSLVSAITAAAGIAARRHQRIAA